MSWTVESDAHVRAMLERSGCWPVGDPLRTQIELARQVAGGSTDEMLEMSEAMFGNDRMKADVLVVLMRDALILVSRPKRKMLRSSEPAFERIPFTDLQDSTEDESLADRSVMWLGHQEARHFLLSWGKNRAERDRMFRLMFSAHGGSFAPWGIQLDPANYVADFERYYAEIVDKEPGYDGLGDEWREWFHEEYGDFHRSNALGLAAEWRQAELRDASGHGFPARVPLIAHSAWRIEDFPESQRVIVRLGEQLFDQGLLAPPYDERTFNKPEDPITNMDAGPGRLQSLMSLAAYAHRTRDPRAAEFSKAAQAGLAVVPAYLFDDNMRHLWAPIAELPQY